MNPSHKNASGTAVSKLVGALPRAFVAALALCCTTAAASGTGEFALRLPRSEVEVSSGSGATIPVMVSFPAKVNSEVRLAASGLPAGVTATFDPATLDASGTALLRLAAAIGAPAGDATIAVTAAAGSVQGTSSFTLRVGTPAAFTLSVPTGSVTITPGESGSYRLVIASGANFREEVDLQVEGLPRGASASFDPPRLAGAGESTLTIRTMADTAMGASVLRISASTRTAAQSATATLLIADPSDFVLALASRSRALISGKSATYDIHLSRAGSGSSQISFHTLDLPAGMTATFSPETLSGTGITKLTLSGSPAAGGGRLPFRIVATAGSVKRSASAFVTVKERDFRIGTRWTARTVRRGMKLQQTVMVSPLNGFEDPVSLSVNGLPQGAAAKFDPPVLSGAGASRLILETGDDSPRGTFRLSVTATAGHLKRSIPLELTVDDPDFDLAVSPNVQVLALQGKCAYTIAISPANAFTGPVSLGVSGLPAGVTGAFAPASVAGNGTSKLTPQATASAIPATYVINVTASSGTISHSAPVTVVVSDEPDYQLSITPQERTVFRGATAQYTITVTPVNGFTDPVQLELAGVPNGSLVTLNPTSLTSGTSALAIEVGPDSEPDTYTLIVTGTSGDDTKTEETELTVLGPLPSPWLSGDVGNVSTTGASGYDAGNGSYTLAGSGGGIEGRADAFHYLYQPFSGDGTVIARITGFSSANNSSLAGVMIRQTLDPASPNVFIGIAGNTTPRFQYRSSAGDSTSSISGTAVTLAYWVKLVRQGNVFSGYVSADGENWVQVGVPVTVEMGSSVYAGLAVTARSDTALATASFDNVSVVNGQDFLLSVLPGATIAGGVSSYTVNVNPLSGFTGTVALSAAGGPAGTGLSFSPASLSAGNASLNVTVLAGATPGTYPITITGTSGAIAHTATVDLLVSGTGTGTWGNQDIGGVQRLGSVAFDGATGTYTVKGSGGGIEGTTDEFHYVSQPFSGDGTIVARITGFENVNNSSLAGVMIRQTLDPASANVFMAITGNGVPQFRYRTASGGSTTALSGTAVTLPYWVKLVRQGNVFSGYVSADGVSWAQAGVPVTAGMGTTVYAGLAVTARSDTTVVTAGFDNVSVVNGQDFLLSVLPGATIAGGAISYTVNVNPLSGFTGTVALSAAGGPAGTGLSFSPASLSGGNSSLNVTVPAGATPGTYPITITGTGGAITHTTMVDLLVSGTGTGTWGNQDIGGVQRLGSVTFDGGTGTYTVKGSGGGIEGGADEFHYVFQPFSGDGTIVARITGFENVNNSSLAGVMIRQTLDPASANVFMAIAGNAVPQFRYRTGSGGSTSAMSGTTVTLPYWVKLARQGNVFSGFVSADGVSWAQLGVPVTVGMGSSVYAGLAVTARSDTALATASFDNVSVVNELDFLLSVVPGATIAGGVTSYTVNVNPLSGFSGTVALSAAGGPAGTGLSFNPASLSAGNSILNVTVPAGSMPGMYPVTVTATSGVLTHTATVNLVVNGTGTWANQDIGDAQRLGSVTFDGATGTYTVKGSGGGIEGGTDAFHYLYQPFSGDGTVIARITGFASANNSSLAGVMIRQTLDPTSPNVFVGIAGNTTPRFQYRSSAGGSTSSTSGTAVTLPYWVKLVRQGNVFSGYISADGVSWVQVGASVTVATGGSVYAGLAASARDAAAWATATFDNVAMVSAPDFLLSVSRTAVASGSDLLYGVTVTPIGGFGDPVVLTASGEPAGSIALIVPATVSGSGSATLTFTPGSATSGFYTITITAVSGTISHSETVRVTVGDPLVSPWTSTDVGAPGLAGSANFNGTTFTVRGSGQYINDGSSSHADSLQYAYRPLTGDGTIVARIASKGNGFAGVMIREVVEAGARNVAMLLSGNSLRFTSRGTPGAGGATATGATVTVPYWVKLVRQGNSFSGYASADGTNWTQVGTTVSVTMSSSAYVGLLVCSGSQSALSTAAFDNVSVVNSEDFLLSVLPKAAVSGSSIQYAVNVSALTGFSGAVGLNVSGLPEGASASFNPSTVTGSGVSTLTVTVPGSTAPSSYPLTITGTSGALTHAVTVRLMAAGSPAALWTNDDIGSVGAVGSADFNGTTFTVRGSGQYINYYAQYPDSLQYVYRSLTGDGTIVARIASKGNGYAGVMIWDSPEGGARNVGMVLNGNALRFTRRTTPATTGETTNGATVTVPYWVKLVRQGNSFSGYASADGTNWTQVGTPVGVAMSSSVYVGLLVCSGSPGALSTAIFDNVSVVNSDDFVLSVLPKAAVSGSSVQYAVNVNALTSFSGAVGLSLSGLPEGASGNFNPSTVTGSGTSTLTVTVPGSTVPSSYPLTITGTRSWTA